MVVRLDFEQAPDKPADVSQDDHVPLSAR